MRQTVSTVSTTRSGGSENHLDALLDDLQSTISRSGSLRGMNGTMSGYREVRRTVRDDATGENSTEYSIEYLHPANSTTHVRELSPASPDPGYSSTGLSSVREVSKYNTSSSLRKSDQQLALTNTSSSGIDSGLLDPSAHMEERHFVEERREVRGPRRELVFTGPKSREPSPTSALAFPTSPGYDRPIRQEVYRYEKTTTSKTIAPDGTVIYHDGDGGRKSLEEVRTVRSPSPQYIQYRDPSPGRIIESSPGYGKTNQSYSYSSSHESRKATRTPPPPHRSPSPVSFNAPPNPPTPPVTVRSSRTTTSSYENNYHTSVPQPKFTPIGTSSNYSVTTKTTTNKYTDNKPRPFPNPSTPPLAGDQQPPKRLDDLMATFDSQDMREVNEYTTRSETTNETRRTTSTDGHHVVHIPVDKKGPVDEKIIKQKSEVREETKNISGPPVYYPKGELFTKKEESQTHSQSASGGGKYKAKRNYKYESGSKYKESSDTKVVPVCVPCPCCCAAPCSIM